MWGIISAIERGGNKAGGLPGRRRVCTAILSIFALGAFWQPALSPAAAPTAITVFPADAPATGNCYPFGMGGGLGAWTPYAGFVYKNIPAFELKPGDSLDFDTNGVNNVDVQLEIALARTTTNGGNAAAQPFTTIVTNTQTPANPRGNTTQGDFDLRFTAQAPFSFPGGGLIIRFSNPSATYATDTTCSSDLVAGTGADSSGFFVERIYNDPDGGDPWAGGDTGDVGAFRLILANPSSVAGAPSNAFSFGKVTRNKNKGTATLPVTVPGPGQLVLAGNRIKGARLGRGAVAGRAVSGPGVVNLTIRARRDFRKKLKEDGKLVVKAKTTYTPAGGTEQNTQTKRIKLIKR